MGEEEISDLKGLDALCNEIYRDEVIFSACNLNIWLRNVKNY